MPIISERLQPTPITLRTKHHNSIDVPIKTCAPWKPVATKKIFPTEEALSTRDSSPYSAHCKHVNINPNNTVAARENRKLLPLINSIWAQVTKKPLPTKMKELRTGTHHGSKTNREGQSSPKSSTGTKE